MMQPPSSTNPSAPLQASLRLPLPPPDYHRVPRQPDYGVKRRRLVFYFETQAWSVPIKWKPAAPAAEKSPGA